MGTARKKTTDSAYRRKFSITEKGKEKGKQKRTRAISLLDTSSEVLVTMARYRYPHRLWSVLAIQEAVHNLLPPNYFIKRYLLSLVRAGYIKEAK